MATVNSSGSGSERDDPNTTNRESAPGAEGQSARAAEISHSEDERKSDRSAQGAELGHPGSLPAEIWGRVQAINANCIAKLRGNPRPQAICVAVQECYDVLVEDCRETDGSLPESVLVSVMPQRVLELAIELGWLNASILDQSKPEPRDPAQPPREYMVEPAYRTWLWELLEPRAEYWRARQNAGPLGSGLPRPEFVVRRLPATTPAGLLLQFEVELKEILAKEPRPFSERRLIEIMVAAGVPPEEITIRRMFSLAREIANDLAVPNKIIADWYVAIPRAGDPGGPVKPGPRPDRDSCDRVKQIVRQVADGKRWRDNLDEVCDALDEGGIACPKTWSRRIPKIATWADAAITDRALAVHAIQYRLDARF